jgi:hypothetical protein
VGRRFNPDNWLHLKLTNYAPKKGLTRRWHSRIFNADKFRRFGQDRPARKGGFFVVHANLQIARVQLVSWPSFSIVRWNRLSYALGFLLLELVAMSAKEEIGLGRLIWTTVATLSIFGFCYWLEDSLRRRERKFLLLVFQGLFGICFAVASLLLVIKMMPS